MEELKQKIIDLCNESELPLEAVMFVTKDVWRDVERTYRDYQSKEKKVKEENCNEEETE